MLSIIKTCSLNGLEVYGTEVEIDLSNGLPTVNIVGLADLEVKESKERVRAAIKNCDMDFPLKRITINLAPADTKKEGTHYDLPIALGILEASGQIYPKKSLDNTFVIGELSLDGKVNAIKGVLPMLLEMMKKDFTKVIIPWGNLPEAKHVPGIECIGIKSLTQLVNYLQGEEEIAIQKGIEGNLKRSSHWDVDFADMKGQNSIKRAMEIAAAGSHNLLMVGPPGSGKTMAAKRLPTILPRLSYQEAIEVTKLYSIAGLLDSKEGLIHERPFRSPHHTISNIALTGGGRVPKPGEVSLSHCGVLFLDELPEFNKMALEVLRQPLEDGEISISRANGSYTFPSSFMLIASMNPCPCGFYNTSNHHLCTCSPQQIKRYTSKISGPLLDRIDIVVDVTAVKYNDLVNKTEEETSEVIRSRVERAREIQINRYKDKNIINNSQLTASALKKYCRLDDSAEKLMEEAFKKMNLSGRGYNRILKVARTIADIDGSSLIKEDHVSEALQYRNINSLFR